jgi:anti-anti-sigma factor
MNSSFDVTPLEDPRRYRLSGELGMATADRLSEALQSDCAGPGDIILDLSGLTFLDSTGLQVIISTCGTLGNKGSLVLRNPNEDVAHVLNVSGVDRLKGLRIER